MLGNVRLQLRGPRLDCALRDTPCRQESLASVCGFLLGYVLMADCYERNYGFH